MSIELPMPPIDIAADVAAAAGVVLLMGIDIMPDVVLIAISIMAGNCQGRLYAGGLNSLFRIYRVLQTELAQSVAKQDRGLL